VTRQLRRHIEQRLIVLARHNEHVAGVHRLNVQEGESLRVLVADGDFAATMNQLAENARTGRCSHGGLASGFRPLFCI